MIIELDHSMDDFIAIVAAGVLFDILSPNIIIDPNSQGVQIIPGPVIGSALLKDTSKVNGLLSTIIFGLIA